MDNKSKLYYKEYKTRLWASGLFYATVLICPLFILLSTYLTFLNFKQNWWIILSSLLFLGPLEIFGLRNLKVRITIDTEGLTIYRGNKIHSAKWDEITVLKELLFGTGELTYIIKTNDRKKTLFFHSSIGNCDDLLKEIENHTNLKFKQRF